MQDQPTKEQDLETLKEYLEDRFVDVPKNRKDVSDSGNVRWLGRNLSIRNKVPEDVMAALKRELKRLHWEAKLK